ncbi:transposase [Streptomyces sp. ISL-43]|uniref:transposase n=1 Tax=Streptomyces sp. ISL-43 TaxID=2819183 RepID=UPI0027E4BF09|nr:transposase [Streptomyces sp. ISL-43]
MVITVAGVPIRCAFLTATPLKVALSKLVNSLKGVGSRRLSQQYTGQVNRAITHGQFWSRPYFAGSCGGAPLTVVRPYIESQQRPA